VADFPMPRSTTTWSCTGIHRGRARLQRRRLAGRASGLHHDWYL